MLFADGELARRKNKKRMTGLRKRDRYQVTETGQEKTRMYELEA